MAEATWKVDTSSPVLVTGAEGYIAGVLIKQLLDAGATVHGTVRDLSKPEEFKYLTDVADDSPGSIKLFRADLTEPGSFAEGMKGCSVVFHIASPVSLMVDDPQKELVDPAVSGTRDVLNTATKTLSVRRVVMTSSVAAIYTDASDTNNAPGNILTEDNINMTASIDYQPYYYAKVLAEMAAWQVAGSQNQWTMATINPAFVTGPGLKFHASSESFKILISMGGGKYKDGVPNLGMGYVDVQDVAKAHIIAAYKEGVAGRHILCAKNSNFVEAAAVLRKKFPQYPVPVKSVPKTLLYLAGPYINPLITRKFVANNIDVALNLDNSKSKRELGIEYRPWDKAMISMFEQIIESGGVEKK